MTDKTYWVEQGATSPRDGSIGWRHWGAYPDRATAAREAKKLGLARVLEVRELVLYKQGHRVVTPKGE